MPAATTTQLGKGSKFGYAAPNATPTNGKFTYIDVPTVVSCNPGYTTGETENRVLSTGFLGYLATNQEAEWSVTIQYVPGNTAVTALLGYMASSAVCHFELMFPDTLSHVIADGFIKQWDITVENDSIIEAELSIRINTQPVYETLSA